VTPKQETLGGKYSIGREIRPGVYAADPGDGAPDGTTHQGFVKRVRKTPFGAQAWWEKAAQGQEGKP
jgi:hypothetical protein